MLLIQGDNQLQQFTHRGDQQVRVTLRSWMDSYCSELKKKEFNVGLQIEIAPLQREYQRYGARLALRFKSKETRDNTCRQLVQSPDRKRVGPGTYVQAKLIMHQLKNKQFMWEQLSEAAPTEIATDSNTCQKVGYKVFLVADQVLIYSAGYGGFRIDLNLSQEKIQQLLLQALMLCPNDPSSMQQLSAYKQSIRLQQPNPPPMPRLSPNSTLSPPPRPTHP